MFAALGLHTAQVDDVTEVGCDDGSLIRLLRGDRPSRAGLGVWVRDVADAAQRLDEHRTPWRVVDPNVIRVDRGDLAVTVGQRRATGLAAVTLHCADVAAAAQFWTAVGGTVTDTAADDDPEPDDPAVDVELGGVVLQLRPTGLQPPTAGVHMLVRTADPLTAAEKLVGIGCGFEVRDAAAVTRSPEGCGVRLSPTRR